MLHKFNVVRVLDRQFEGLSPTSLRSPDRSADKTLVKKKIYSTRPNASHNYTTCNNKCQQRCQDDAGLLAVEGRVVNSHTRRRENIASWRDSGPALNNRFRLLSLPIPIVLPATATCSRACTPPTRRTRRCCRATLSRSGNGSASGAWSRGLS